MAEHHVGHPSADDEYATTPAEAGHEHTDAHVWIIVKFAFWLAVSALLIHVGIWFMFALSAERREVTGEQAYPLAVGQPRRLPAQPRLQQFPANEFYQFRQQEENMLRNYGWVNREAGTVHIPISEAMRLTVERGLPARPQTQDAEGQAATPGLMPADSSAGRTMERRRQ